MVSLSWSNQDLANLTNVILSCPLSATLTEDQKPLILAIDKLKPYMTNDGSKITTVSS